jgi:poly(ADP-ribose) glycohydrolase ARH3
MSTTRAELADLLEGAFRSGQPRRDEILAVAIDRHARPEVLTTLRSLPERDYRDVDEVWAQLPGVIGDAVTIPGSLEDRLVGVLVGTALGDAVGAAFEGVAAPDVGELDARLAGADRLRWTDDTHMALALASSLIATEGRVDAQHLGDTFARAYADEPWRGYGPGPPKVFAEAARGKPYVEAATALFGGAGSLGNGGAMRAAPAAIVGYPDLEEVARTARAQAAVTHAHPEGQDGSVLIAGAICMTVGAAELNIEPVDAIEQVGQVLRTEEMNNRLAALIEAVREGASLAGAVGGRATDVTAAGRCPPPSPASSSPVGRWSTSSAPPCSSAATPTRWQPWQARSQAPPTVPVRSTQRCSTGSRRDTSWSVTLSSSSRWGREATIGRTADPSRFARRPVRRGMRLPRPRLPPACNPRRQPDRCG